MCVCVCVCAFQRKESPLVEAINLKTHRYDIVKVLLNKNALVSIDTLKKAIVDDNQYVSNYHTLKKKLHSLAHDNNSLSVLSMHTASLKAAFNLCMVKVWCHCRTLAQILVRFGNEENIDRILNTVIPIPVYYHYKEGDQGDQGI